MTQDTTTCTICGGRLEHAPRLGEVIMHPGCDMQVMARVHEAEDRARRLALREVSADDHVRELLDDGEPGVIVGWLLVAKVASPDDATSVLTVTDERSDVVTHLGLAHAALLGARDRYRSGMQDDDEELGP